MSLKSVIKSNTLLTNIAYLARGYWGALHIKKYEHEPVCSSKIVFYADKGRYRCNPKAIAEYIHGNRPEIQMVWVYTNKEYNKEVPDYFRLVKFESRDYYHEMATAGVWVFNLLMPQGTIKRANQLYIQTWHGDKGFKKMAMDAVSNSSYRKKTFGRHFIEGSICDYAIVSNEWFKPIYRRSTGFAGEFIDRGLPRNDCLFSQDRKKIEIVKGRLGIPAEVSVLLYAPTFRDHKKRRGDIGSDIDLPRILDRLEVKDSTQWCCLMRSHNGVDIAVESINAHNDRFKDVSDYADMADLLLVSDMLITDYSSVAGDFALTGKPVLLYQDDIDSYVSKDRGLYFNMEDTPYLAARNTNDALSIIDQITVDSAKQNDEAILDFYGSLETGHATEAVCEIILDFIDGNAS